MLSGGTCWSLWERLGVWMTPTAAVSGTPVIQLNPDRADKAERVCEGLFASDWPAVLGGGPVWGVRKGKQKNMRKCKRLCLCVRHKQSLCVCASGGGDVPVAVDSGHTAVNSVRHRRKKMEDFSL